MRARIPQHQNILWCGGPPRPSAQRSDPRLAFGDLVSRGVRGIVLEAFGTGNMPNHTTAGWLPWLREQRRKGLIIYLGSQCSLGPLHPELYKAGSVALSLGCHGGPQMTPGGRRRQRRRCRRLGPANRRHARP